MRLEDLAKDLLQQINTRVRSRLPVFQKQLSNLLETTLNNSREVELIRTDENIRGQLGLSSMDKLFSVNKLLAQDIRIDFRPFRLTGSKITGYVRALCIEMELRPALESPDAYEFVKVRAANWPYFEWLVFGGDEIIGYHYLPTRVAPRAKDYSRTGIGIMARAKAKSWNMPSQISGTRGNNYISRATNSVDFYNKLDPLLYSLIN